MFPWNIAKSAAERVISRWAVKRVCKFMLKKKLGQFILGDIDLDQLDVQLTKGIIQLNDLALDVDYLNQKIGPAASVIIKEGSIGSLLVKLPFHVEVDELELVLAPCSESNSPAGESCSFSQDGNHYTCHDLSKPGPEIGDDVAKSTFGDVHEGVKTIAKMVKSLLTNFHVKIKKLIIAFDPFSEKDAKKAGCRRALVLRISETECGTCGSEDADSNGDVRIGSFLGTSRLTNFVKFRGAVIELLQMDSVDGQTYIPCASGTNFGEPFLGASPSNSTTPIVTGNNGGFSGNLKLSIPWKNGSVDIRKVDADVCIDPVELRFQPSTIKWFLLMWEICKDLDRDGGVHMHYKSTDAVCLSATSYYHSSPSVTDVTATDKAVPIHGSSPSNLFSLTGQELVTEAMLPGSHLIMDWVPFSVNKDHMYGVEEEFVDLGASVDQFFECFDEIRSSQSALGSSGVWNWTCSVFSAITAASSLASGSLHIPSEQQHVQTNLKATFAGIFISFSFHDEDHEHFYDLKGDQINVNSDVHYLGAEFRDSFLSLQVCPQEMRFEGTVKYIEVADYVWYGNKAVDLGLRGCNTESNCPSLSIQHLQAEVEDALPSFAFSCEYPNSDEIGGPVASNFPFQKKRDVAKIKLLRTSGITRCQLADTSNLSDGCVTGPKLFSLELPPFIFWFNFWLLKMLLDLLKEVGESVEMNHERNAFPVESLIEKHGSSPGVVEGGSVPGITTLSSAETLRGNISILNARLVLCFPFGSGKDIEGYSSWNQFIALEFSSPSILNKGTSQNTSPDDSTSQKRNTSRATCSLRLNVGNLDIHLVTSTFEDDVGMDSCVTRKRRFYAQNILSATGRTGGLSVISMLWREGPVTGPWITERAKSLAASEESGRRNKFMGKGYEFATVTTVNDLEDINSQTQQEMILSSAFSLHFCLLPVTIKLGGSQYKALHSLLDQMVNDLSYLSCDAVGDNKESSMSQTSVFVECDSVEILIRPDIKENIRSSMQSELPGSWHCLKLAVDKFNLLSVSNVGGVSGANFFWITHGEGKLWGSITGVGDQEFLLISCSNSTMKRGDGGGSNALSSRFAGSDIVHLWEPRSFHSFTSITVRCSTMIAVGGRLDWLDAIPSFFSVPSPEVELVGDDSLQKSDINAPCGTSFVLNLVDIGLSYEPHLKKSVVTSKVSDYESGSSHFREENCEPYVSSLLAASSLTLSNTTVEDLTDYDYKIRVQDLGLLLCMISESWNLSGTYSAEHLHKIGYVNVAREAFVQAILRTKCKNGLLWELECSKSQICIETCHDTTTGLIRLAAQLQQLFAPDVEESLVHLQTRWNNVQQAPERNDLKGCDSMPSTSQLHTSSRDTHRKSEMAGLMDEVCDDAFHFNGSQARQFDSSEAESCISPDENLFGDAFNLGIEASEAEILSNDIYSNGSVPIIGLESAQMSFLQKGCLPEPIEGYCLSDLCRPSELSAGSQSSLEILKCRPGSAWDKDLGRGNSGWYGDTSFRIVENHISEASEQTIVEQVLDSSIDCAKTDDFGNAVGRVLLKDINIRWKMFAGSDWHKIRRSSLHSSNIRERGATGCLELALSGMQFQYDIFPVGGICISKLSLSVQDLHLYDNSTTAPWKLMLDCYHSKDHPRQSSSKVFKLDLEAIRPDPLTPLEEYRLRIAFLPLLLHLHQSQLDFLISFFGEKHLSVDQSSDCNQDSGGTEVLATKSNDLVGKTIAEEALLPYFQKFDIWPILVRVNYSSDHVDMAQLKGGKCAELINLVPWKGVELQLKHVHGVGVYGWASVCKTIIGEWLEDISQNQIHKVLQGLAPIRSLVSVGAGAAKLVSLPVESYKKDHRVFKGLQRGTIAFLKSISVEAVGLGVHLAAGAHDLLLQAEYVLTSIPPPVSCSVRGKTNSNVRCNQPKGAQQGFQQACECLSDGLGKSASALVRGPLKKYQGGASAGSALATAVRAVPAAALAPASACASAAHYALLGLRNSLDPEHKKESMDKYLGPSKPEEQN